MFFTLFNIIMPMLNGYSPKSLEKIISLQEVIKLKLGRDREEISNKLAKISYAISDPDFKFENVKTRIFKNQILFSTDSSEEYLALKLLDRVIRRIYQVSFTDKHSTTNCMVKILQDEKLHSIARLDFKSFFESVPRHKIIKKIIDDSMLSQELLVILEKIDKKLADLNYSGLPRGLSLSSTLSEIYLRDLDRKVKSYNSTYYYARYVDDIIVISLDDIKHTQSLISKNCESLELNINWDKSLLINRNDNLDFDYLGFNFRFYLGKLKVSLSIKKIKKIKTRIIKSILDYSKNKDSKLLIKRIKYLTTNHTLYQNGEESVLKSGIYYTNQIINDFNCLSDLDSFLRKSISSKKGTYAKKVSSIPLADREIIFKMSFFNGFINKTLSEFSKAEHRIIKDCWDNE